MWLLRVAIAHKKILLVDWTKPAALTNFLVPNEIDWTFSGFPPQHFNVSNTLGAQDFSDAVYSGTEEAVKKFHATKMHVVNTNQHFYVNIMAGVTPVDYDRKVDIGSCYYNFLFKLNTTISNRGEAHLRQLYGPTSVDYIAWHWRHYDADNPPGKEDPVRISELAATMSCARRLAGEVGVNLDQRPVLLVTDFNIFRQIVADGELRRVTTLNITARHIDRLKSEGDEAHDAHSLDVFSDIFVDLYVLSHARCLLTSRSGFSKLALWMAGGPLLRCHRDMVKCEEERVWRRR